MKSILLWPAMVFAIHTALAQPDADALLGPYLDAKEALVRGDGRSVAAHASTLLKVLQGQPDFPEKAALVRSVQSMAGTTVLDQQRVAFADMSIGLWAVVKRANALKRDIYYQYCPMKKAYWLSGDAAIRNPYYGSKMLTCGKVAEKRLR